MTRSRFALVFAILLLGAFESSAQLGYVPYRTRKFSAGASVGVGTVLGDISNKWLPRPLLALDAAYNVNPFLSFGLEARIGIFESQSDKSGLYKGLESTNTYQSFDLHWRFALGLLTGSRPTRMNLLVNGLYVGVGGGVIRNSIGSIKDEYTTRRNGPVLKIPSGQLKTQSITPFIPVIVGWEYELPAFGKVENTSLSLLYQFGYTFDDYLDGYNVAIAANKRNDAFSIFQAGLRWHFGRLK